MSFCKTCCENEAGETFTWPSNLCHSVHTDEVTGATIARLKTRSGKVPKIHRHTYEVQYTDIYLAKGSEPRTTLFSKPLLKTTQPRTLHEWEILAPAEFTKVTETLDGKIVATIVPAKPGFRHPLEDWKGSTFPVVQAYGPRPYINEAYVIRVPVANFPRQPQKYENYRRNPIHPSTREMESTFNTTPSNITPVSHEDFFKFFFHQSPTDTAQVSNLENNREFSSPTPARKSFRPEKRKYNQEGSVEKRAATPNGRREIPFPPEGPQVFNDGLALEPNESFGFLDKWHDN